MIIPKEQRLGYEYRNYHHYAAIILELGTVGKILVTASILDLSNFKFQEFIMMSPIEFYLPGTYPPGTYVPLSTPLDLLFGFHRLSVQIVTMSTGWLSWTVNLWTWH